MSKVPPDAGRQEGGAGTLGAAKLSALKHTLFIPDELNTPKMATKHSEKNALFLDVMPENEEVGEGGKARAFGPDPSCPSSSSFFLPFCPDPHASADMHRLEDLVREVKIPGVRWAEVRMRGLRGPSALFRRCQARERGRGRARPISPPGDDA